jgi:hypothetical protein
MHGARLIHRHFNRAIHHLAAQRVVEVNRFAGLIASRRAGLDVVAVQQCHQLWREQLPISKSSSFIGSLVRLRRRYRRR